MPTTPAGFGRAMQFGNAAPVPIWRRGEITLFPNALGWSNVFQVEDILLDLDYSGPVMDMIAHMQPNLFLTSHMPATISLRSKLVTELDMDSAMPSTRITRIAKDY